MTTETQSMSSCFNLSVERIGYTFAYCLLFAVSLTGNARNPVNYFIANMAISDLLFPIFLIPQVLVQLNTNTWLIDGPLGQALCKLSGYLVDVSSAVSIQSVVIIAVDRFRAVVFPLRSPLISSKRCRFFILATWIIAMVVFCPYLESCGASRGAGVRETVESGSWRVFAQRNLFCRDDYYISVFSFGFYWPSEPYYFFKNESQ